MLYAFRSTEAQRGLATLGLMAAAIEGAVSAAAGLGAGEAASLDAAGGARGRAGERASASAEEKAVAGAEGGICSFAAQTPVATPGGERAIASLHVGDRVVAYDAATGQTSTQTVQHVWINHDADLLDVTLRVADQPGATASVTKQQRVAARGWR